MKKSFFIAIAALTAACTSTTPAPTAPQDIAPASVAGLIIEMDGNGAESCSARMHSHKWTEWQPEENPCTFAYEFDSNNHYRVNFAPATKAYLTYKKAGPNTAVINNNGAPNHGIYTLSFDTPTSGTATNIGSANGRNYMTRNIKFRIITPVLAENQ